ncbi:MAG: hypothetical protein GXY83_01815 [Rhodopirellula sp.]|nr:hypothetical protein [Rhodopirellula sp.]
MRNTEQVIPMCLSATRQSRNVVRACSGSCAEAMLAIVADSDTLDSAAVQGTWRRFLTHSGGPAWSRAWAIVALGCWLDARRRVAACRAEAAADFSKERRR